MSRIVAAAALVFAGGCEQTLPQSVLAQFLGGDGEVFLTTKAGERTALSPGSLINSGQTVETTEGATALISLLPHMALQLNGGTVLTVEQVQMRKNGNAMTYPVRHRRAQVRLVRGSLSAVTPSGFTEAELQVHTPRGAVVAPERSAFFVEARGESVRVVNCAGRLMLREMSGAARALPVGYYVDIAPSGQLPHEPRLAVVEQAAAEQSDAAADMARFVSELTERLAAAPPPWRSR